MPSPTPDVETDRSRLGDLLKLFELSTDLFCTTSPDGWLREVSPAWEATLGWTPRELRASRLFELVHPDDLERTTAVMHSLAEPGSEIANFENRFRCKDGSWCWLCWTARFEDGVWFAVAKDVSDHKLLERRAIHDALTGLPNRSLLVDRLDHALQRLRRTRGSVAVLFIDLDRFKVINDMGGHEAGDEALKAAARRLEATVRDVDTVGRLGGDEFVVVVEDLGGPSQGAVLASRIVEAFAEPLIVAGEEMVTGASVGMATAGSNTLTTPEQLLHEADTAMYRAKDKGRGRFELFDQAMRLQVEDRLELARELRHALPRDELRLVYQPIVSLVDGSVAGCEALLRWRHPDRGMVMPLSFISLAEENAMILPIGEWVLEQACRQGAEWRRAGHDIPVSVNVSPNQLAQPDFASRVDAIAHAAGLPAQCLCLELVESTVVRQPDRIAESLHELSSHGVRIALDDFGVGATSLAYFRSLPLDVVKLDRSYVSGLRNGGGARAIVKSILALAGELGMAVVAEGVESEDQVSELHELGCEFVQGYWFAHPAEPESLALDGFNAGVRPGLGDPFVIREFMRQIGIPARIQ